jgi:hypothetical protein
MVIAPLLVVQLHCACAKAGSVSSSTGNTHAAQAVVTGMAGKCLKNQCYCS